MDVFVCINYVMSVFVGKILMELLVRKICGRKM